jgi:hypothetical protein
MDEQRAKSKQQNVVISHYMMMMTLLQTRVGWLKNGWTERAYIKTKKKIVILS